MADRYALNSLALAIYDIQRKRVYLELVVIRYGIVKNSSQESQNNIQSGSSRLRRSGNNDTFNTSGS